MFVRQHYLFGSYFLRPHLCFNFIKCHGCTRPGQDIINNKMRYFIHLTALVLITLLMSACSSEANRLHLRPVSQKSTLGTVQPTQSSAKSTNGGSFGASIVGELPPSCTIKGLLYHDQRVKCGPVIQEDGGGLLFPVFEDTPLENYQFEQPQKILFEYHVIQSDEANFPSEECQSITPVSIKCFTVIE
jgi:hypothetical protein